jgi:hypothetical protein
MCILSTKPFIYVTLESNISHTFLIQNSHEAKGKRGKKEEKKQVEEEGRLTFLCCDSSVKIDKSAPSPLLLMAIALALLSTSARMSRFVLLNRFVSSVVLSLGVSKDAK